MLRTSRYLPRPRTASHSRRGVGIVKRLLLCLMLLCACISAPGTAHAWMGWVVFTFSADPLDPLGGTSTGWLAIPKSDSNGRPHWASGPIDFWWQAQHWTTDNTVGSTWIDWYPYVPGGEALLSWSLSGGPEEEYLWGNSFSHDFDFNLGGKSPCGPFNIGEILTASMGYVNPTASRFAANGQYYVSIGSFYFTDQQPAPSEPPGASEPGSVGLAVLGIVALAMGGRRTARP